MYLPEDFKENDFEEIKAIVEQFPFATCVANIGNDFELNHFPMIWRDDKLIGHIAFANSMHKSLEDGCKAAFIFKAENSYVSPNWYPTKAQHHKHVPTWNYQVVHMHGELYFKHSEKEKISAVGLLTQLHEKRLNGSNAWKMRDAPKDYMKTMLDGIVGIELHIKRLEAKSKLSQNREKIDYTAVMHKMDEMQFVGMNKRMKSLVEK
ncbi:FMN-binding negative transcriptional regulator [Planktomarina temperata]|nr:FMN-binding negative transcriptional regulator [Planktomarina temperata]